MSTDNLSDSQSELEAELNPFTHERNTMSNSPTFLSRSLFLFLCVGMISTVGCVPGVTWLPDSSGLVYTNNKGELRILSATTGKTRRLAIKCNGTIWPAVSPDGKRFASVDLQRVHTRGVGFEAKFQTRIQINVHSPTGEQVHQSPVLDWGPERAKGFYSEQVGKGMQLFWSRADRILLSCENTAGLYHLKTKKLQTFSNSMLSVISQTPVRPDGKGFLLLPGVEDKKMRLQFVDWKGQSKTIRGVTENLRNDNKEDEALLSMLAVPPVFHSRWKGSTAVISWSGKELQINTDKGMSSWHKYLPKRTDEDKIIQYVHQLPGTKVSVRLVEVTPRKDLPNAVATKHSYRIEVVLAESDKPKILAQEAQWVRPFPSPDGKYLALRYTAADKQGETERLLLVNSAGKEVTNVPVKD